MQSFFTLSRLAVAAAACAFSLHAQCYDSTTGVSVGTGDDTVLAAQTLPFPFPFNGSTYTTVHPCTNGFVYLGNGTASTAANCCTGIISTMTAATSPMIAPWWTDLNVVLGTGSVKFNATASKAVVTWENAIEFGGSTVTGLFSMQLQLYPTGEMDFVYDGRVAVRGGHTFLVGMSPGSGAISGAATDFSVVGAGATNTNYELFGPALGSVSLTGKGVHFVPTNPGYVWVATNCSASHTSYGTGCYNLPASVYQEFTDANLASTGLTGNAMMLAMSGGGYAASWLPGAAGALYVAPTGGATVLPADDDGDALVTLPSALPTPGGPVTQITVSHNGIITLGSTGNNTFDYTPTGPELVSAAGAGFYSWHDWNDTEAGSGALKTELAGGNLFCVTWDGVESYANPEGPNPGTQQFQLDLTTGAVTYVWTSINNNTTSIFGSAYVVGYKGPGAQTDGGSVNLSSALPATYNWVPGLPLVLTASPAPVSTPISGTVVTYTTSNIPEYYPTSGIYIAMNILSLGQIPAPGLDLIIIGAPGCPAFVSSLDVTQAMVGASNSQSVTFSIPPGVPAGLTIYSQSAALVQPFSLPNGQNAFGLTTSNGIASVIQPQ